MLDEKYVKEDLELALSKGYLGNFLVIDGILRTFANKVMTSKYVDDDYQEIETKAKEVAEILLGEDKSFPGSKWNSPGQIDAYVGRIEGIDSEDPKERISGALINMVVKLIGLARKVEEQKLTEEQWQSSVRKIFVRYAYLMLGAVNLSVRHWEKLE